MKLLILSFFMTTLSMASPKTETFVIIIDGRHMNVFSPEKKMQKFSVIVENRSLSDQVGKFTINGKLLKYVSVKSGKSESVEIENKADENIVFVPVSPSFQEVPLFFGKKAYEIPSKE